MSGKAGVAHTDFLHTVFLRLNTGSVTLSPQELRQALLPGPFSEYVDDAAAKSEGLQELLGLSQPDPRMRDIEILARFLAFRFFADSYPGRMKRFLDDSFDKFNESWQSYRTKVQLATADFERGVKNLISLFGEQVARKPDSAQFNRAIFDALIYYHSQKSVREAIKSTPAKNKLKREYNALFAPESEFSKAIESDTAGLPNTTLRLKTWGSVLSKVARKRFSPPRLPSTTPRRRRSSPNGLRQRRRRS